MALGTSTAIRLSPARDLLAGATSLAAGWALALWAWERIVLPFANPLGIVGPLTLRQFNPTNNLLRYLVFILLPALLYAALAWRLGERSPAAPADEAAGPGVGARAAAGLALACAAVAAAAALLRMLSAPLAPTHLDFFHAGEWLAPGWNLAEGRGLWRGSLFIHGAFYDAVGTALAWDLFGQRTIGAGVVLQELLRVLVAPALAVAVLAMALCANPGRRSPGAWVVAVGLALVITDLVTVDTLQELNRRDVPVLVGVAALLFGVYFQHPAGFFVAGTCSSLAFFYTIDRGAYFTVAAGATAALLWLREPRALGRSMAWALAGLLLGWAVFAAGVGFDELRAFVDTSRFFATTKDLLDSYVYPKPTLLPPSFRAAAPLCIAVQVVLTVRLLLRGAPREAVAAQVLVTTLAVVYFRSGLGRSDPYHVRYASTFAFLGLTFAVCNAIGAAIVRRPRLTAALLAALGALGAGLAATTWWPAIDLARVRTSPDRLRALIAAPDDAWLTPTERRVRDRLAVLTAGDSCAFAFTSEGAWSFLLKKPTCGRYFIVWFVSAAPLQAALRRDLDAARPSHILLRSPGATNAIDGISNAVRFPALYDAITSAYHPVEEIDGFVIGRRVDAAAP